MYQLVYCSRNEIQGTGEEVADSLLKLLETAQSNNERLHITGALLFISGFFAQVVEGPKDAVEQLFSHIQRDPRHSQVTVVIRGAKTERAFPRWSMVFTDWSIASGNEEEPARLLRAKAAVRAVFANQEGAEKELLAVLKTLR